MAGEAGGGCACKTTRVTATKQGGDRDSKEGKWAREGMGQTC